MNPLNAQCYLVGLIDGDGHMRINRAVRLVFALVGTQAVMQFARDMFASIVPEHPRSAGVFQAKGERVYRYNVSGQRVRTILGSLRRLPCHHLDRKWRCLDDLPC